jgi:hypothetical protein
MRHGGWTVLLNPSVILLKLMVKRVTWRFDLSPTMSYCSPRVLQVPSLYSYTPFPGLAFVLQDCLGTSLWTMSNVWNGMGRIFDTLWLMLDAGQSNKANALSNVLCTTGALWCWAHCCRLYCTTVLFIYSLTSHQGVSVVNLKACSCSTICNCIATAKLCSFTERFTHPFFL